MTNQTDELMQMFDAVLSFREGTDSHDKAIAMFRSALEAALKPGEPVAEIIADEDGYAFIKWHGDESRFHEIHPIGTKFYTAPPAQTQAVCVVGSHWNSGGGFDVHSFTSQPPGGTKLYAAPPAQTPPRLGKEQWDEIFNASQAVHVAKAMRMTEDAVRKQFLGDRDE